MKTVEFFEMIQLMANAWTIGNYVKVADCFNENIYYSDSLSYSFFDKKSLLQFFENDDGQPQKCVFHNIIFDENKQIGAAEYSYEGTHLYHGTVWISIENNKILSWREYQHISEKDWKSFWNKFE